MARPLPAPRLLIALAWLFMLLTAGAAADDCFVSGSVIMLKNARSGHYLHSGTKHMGDPIVQWTTGIGSQWLVQRVSGEECVVMLQSMHSYFYLHVSSHTVEPRDPVIQYMSHSEGSQWQVAWDGSMVMLKSVRSDIELHVQLEAVQLSDPVIQWGSTSPGSQWEVQVLSKPQTPQQPQQQSPPQCGSQETFTCWYNIGSCINPSFDVDECREISITRGRSDTTGWEVCAGTAISAATGVNYMGKKAEVTAEVSAEVCRQQGAENSESETQTVKLPGFAGETTVACMKGMAVELDGKTFISYSSGDFTVCVDDCPGPPCGAHPNLVGRGEGGSETQPKDVDCATAVVATTWVQIAAMLVLHMGDSN